MDTVAWIIILEDLHVRLAEAIDGLESKLPDEFKEVEKGIMGDIIRYPITNEAWSVANSIDRILDRLKEHK